ncbi:uncharacterized protein JCM6883_004486 [Sporobolomyces salmoneus]|uniref:uncharacterized protein n=1 Tax=Sporobolomyces salmoneus TaxID=183962 RepID=UPI003173C25E
MNPPTGFIFSYNSTDSDIRALSTVLQEDLSTHNPSSSSTSRRAGLGSASRGLYADDEFTPYGPTTFRKGAVRFVRGGLLGGDNTEELDVKREDKGKERALDQDEVKEEEAPGNRRKELSGNEVKSLYAGIVSIRSKPATSTASSSSKPILKRARSTPPPKTIPPLSTSSSRREPDIVLSSDSEPEEPLSDADEPLSDDDDVIILDPLTNLPESIPRAPAPSKKKRLKPLLIHELLGDSSSPLVVPPTYYALPETNFGYRLLSKQGWKEGETLGLSGGLKVPLKAIEKFDRKGLGLEDRRKANWKKTRKELEDERREAERAERDRRGKGERGMERTRKREQEERKAWISYMNR